MFTSVTFSQCFHIHWPIISEMDNTAIKRSQSKRQRRIKEKYCRVRTERLDSLGLPSPVQSSNSCVHFVQPKKEEPCTAVP